MVCSLACGPYVEAHSSRWPKACECAAGEKPQRSYGVQYPSIESADTDALLWGSVQPTSVDYRLAELINR